MPKDGEFGLVIPRTKGCKKYFLPYATSPMSFGCQMAELQHLRVLQGVGRIPANAPPEGPQELNLCKPPKLIRWTQPRHGWKALLMYYKASPGFCKVHLVAHKPCWQRFGCTVGGAFTLSNLPAHVKAVCLGQKAILLA